MDTQSSLWRWVAPDETAAEFLGRQSREAVATGLPFVDAHVTLRPGHVLEIVGPTASAKTELLMEVAANLLTRQTPAAAGAAGSGEHVVVVDCDGKFDILRMLQLLTPRLDPTGAAQASPGLASVLARLHVVRCFSSLELLLTLAALPQRLASLQGRCVMLLVDNVSAFQHQDRAASSSEARGRAPLVQQHQGGPARWGDAQRGQGAATALLQQMARQQRLPVVATTQAATGLEDGGQRLQQRGVFVKWQGASVHRLLLLPVVTAAQALPTLLARGPTPTELLLQWQGAGFSGPVQRAAVTPSAVVLSG